MGPAGGAGDRARPADTAAACAVNSADARSCATSPTVAPSVSRA